MHKQSFTEYHSLATKASWVRPSLHFRSKLPEVLDGESLEFSVESPRI